MGDTLHLGPLALPWAALCVLGGWWLGTWVHERLARRQGLGAGPHAWRLGLAALLAARLAFVLAYPAQYAQAPWSALDVRDGGWSPAWGLAAALAYAAFLAWRRSPWRRPVAAGLAAGAGLWLAGLAVQQVSAPAQPARLPQWQGVALNAAPLALPALQGQPVVVNLWATWCPPCRREMPALLQAQAQHPQVRFVFVNQGEAPEVVQRFAAQQGLPAADVVLDAASALGALLGRRALPTTLFFNAEGALVATRTGELSAGSLAHHLEQVLPKK